MKIVLPRDSSNHHQAGPIEGKVAGLIAVVVLSSIVGCYQPAVAPPIEYDAKDAELLSKEIDKLDWE
jgi:hypothetical protein